MGLHDLYTSMVRNHTGFFATWPPGEPIHLGDFGVLDGSLFTRTGNIKTFRIKFRTRQDPTKTREELKSSKDVRITAKAAAKGKAGGADIKASLKIGFGKSEGFYFNAAACEVMSIEDIHGLGKQIVKLWRDGKWSRRLAVVTKLVQAGSSTVVVSLAKNASIGMEAKGNVARIDLADASLRLGVSTEQSIGYRVVTEQGLTPLLQLSGLVSADDFEPFSLRDSAVLDFAELG